MRRSSLASCSAEQDRENSADRCPPNQSSGWHLITTDNGISEPPVTCLSERETQEMSQSLREREGKLMVINGPLLLSNRLLV